MRGANHRSHKLSSRLVATLALCSSPWSFSALAAEHPPRPLRPVMLDADQLRAATQDERDHRFHVVLDGGASAELTLDPRLQKMADRVLSLHDAPYEAVVLLKVDDGRVLAMAGRSPKGAEEKSAADLCLSPWAPAASVFKLVTAAALVDAGVEPDRRVCYHGGVHSVERSNLADDPADKECRSFAFGLAKSQNAIIARLVHDHLKPEVIERFARALGFGEPLGADMHLLASEALVPHEALAFARVAAGFWQSTLSPLHGAFLAATIARGGTTPPLHMVQRLLEGKTPTEVDLPAPRRVLDEETARTIGRMMVGTVEFGTARRGFHDHQGNPYLRRISVAGKTGSLTRRIGGYIAYSWFVGFAPAKKPEIAVAVLLGNGLDWHVKAPQVAREILEGYFHGGHAIVASR